MILTEEIATRLQKNLIFDADTSGAVGAIQILFRDEDPESVKELYAVLRALMADANLFIGLTLNVGKFAAAVTELKGEQS